MSGPRVLIVANGHGEDAIGAAVAGALVERGARVEAVPLVGEGRAWDDAGIPALGPRRALPSGGFASEDPRALARDLRAGFLRDAAAQHGAIRAAAERADALLTVGDWYGLLRAALAAPRRPRYHVQPLVSVRTWPPGAERPWRRPYGPLERALMRLSRATWPRDEASAAWLRERGAPRVACLGNPMLDAVRGDAPLPVPPPYLLLLPGSRDDAERSLPVMLEAARRLRAMAERGGAARMEPVVAWAGGPLERIRAPGWEFRPPTPGPGRLEPPSPERGGRPEPSPPAPAGVALEARHGDGTLVRIARGAFATALRGALVALSTSGTAAEQAAGRGVPLVGFPTAGPQYRPAFAAGQARALGAALALVDPDPDAVARAAAERSLDPALRAAAARAGRAAMGGPGASGRMADALLADLRRLPLRSRSGRDPGREPAPPPRPEPEDPA